jgi:hypothetical protein
MIRLVVEARVLLAVTMPPALPSFGCRSRPAQFLSGTTWGAVQLVMILPGSRLQTLCGGTFGVGTCLAIAQTKPDSSRAIAAVTTVGGLPAKASLR